MADVPALDDQFGQHPGFGGVGPVIGCFLKIADDLFLPGVVDAIIGDRLTRGTDPDHIVQSITVNEFFLFPDPLNGRPVANINGNDGQLFPVV